MLGKKKSISNKKETKEESTIKLTVTQETEGIRIEGSCNQEILCKTVVALLQYIKPETWETFMTRSKIGDLFAKKIKEIK